MDDLIQTSDGSYTLFSERFNQHFHSINGAKTESLHIYINLGLKNFKNSKISILEIGYGTGLNAILTYLHNTDLNNLIFYHGIDNNIIPKHSFDKIFSFITNNDDEIEKFYLSGTQDVYISDDFLLHKELIDFNKFIPTKNYDIIYFDAFSPEVQPDMWSYANLGKIINSLNQGGIFVTYCVQGKIKQTLRDFGLNVKRYPGPPGKRHVLRATKI
ncbi:MAG: tRNA (5-methylaminomethyl-2-thiouridine)(34)-methyltransferase MnmD [Bacteroidales bacterium]|jgi:tRNA U34 5-methylaminomethyl-2-thiouridine-forming methyltransferase MnmC